MLALVRGPLPRSPVVTTVLATIPTTVSSRAVRAITTARQRREAGSGENVPRREAGKDVDIARPDHPLLGVDVPVADVSAIQLE